MTTLIETFANVPNLESIDGSANTDLPWNCPVSAMLGNGSGGVRPTSRYGGGGDSQANEVVSICSTALGSANMTVTATYTAHNGTTGTWVGAAGRFASDTSLTFYLLAMFISTGQWYLLKRTNNVNATLKSGTTSVPSVPFTIGIDCQGDEITPLLNGSPITTPYVDASPLTGLHFGKACRDINTGTFLTLGEIQGVDDVAAGVTVNIDPAIEEDLAHPITVVKTVPISPAIEHDIAHPVTATALSIAQARGFLGAFDLSVFAKAAPASAKAGAGSVAPSDAAKVADAIATGSSGIVGLARATKATVAGALGFGGSAEISTSAKATPGTSLAPGSAAAPSDATKGARGEARAAAGSMAEAEGVKQIEGQVLARGRGSIGVEGWAIGTKDSGGIGRGPGSVVGSSGGSKASIALGHGSASDAGWASGLKGVMATSRALVGSAPRARGVKAIDAVAVVRAIAGVIGRAAQRTAWTLDPRRTYRVSERTTVYRVPRGPRNFQP